MKKAFLCLACYYKGRDFIVKLKELGNEVYVVASSSLRDEDWPRDHIDEIFYLDENEVGVWNLDDLLMGTAHLLRWKKIDCIIALDDFDVERAAFLRESFRIDGMGQTTARYFRDKLAMRTKARKDGIAVPDFSSLFSDQDITNYLNTTSGPWIIKPRGEASATGIQKVNTHEEAWKAIHELGDHRHDYLIECFLLGDVYHVDTLTKDGKTLFSRASRYLRPPFEVAHGGGIFQSITLPVDDPEFGSLQEHTSFLLKAFGMHHGASHSEFLKSAKDGKFYFIETASRVGGAHIAEMVEFATGINLWKEWAALEHAELTHSTYELPEHRDNNAGLIISLINQEYADYGLFPESEIVWRMNKKYHIGMIIQHEDQNRIMDLLQEFAERIRQNQHASLPASKKTLH